MILTTKEFCKKEYGKTLYKISLDAGFSCPNRDGTCGTRGCIFCSEGGSGDFAVKIAPMLSPEILEMRIDEAKAKVNSKFKGDKYIAYFQAYSNTYVSKTSLIESGFENSKEYLRSIFLPVINRPDIEVLSIATRPDCLNEDVYEVLEELSSIKPLWVELGLQTSNEQSARFIRRGYKNSVYEEAVKRLKTMGIHVITHVILYLPNESEADMKNTVRFAVDSGTDGIKLQLLHVLKGTDLAKVYDSEGFFIPTLEEYAEMVKKCIDMIPENIVIHRLTGDAPKSLLIEPKWSQDKKRVLNYLKSVIDF